MSLSPIFAYNTIKGWFYIAKMALLVQQASAKTDSPSKTEVGFGVLT